jgi:REP element-mobilizing transposase RayT
MKPGAYTQLYIHLVFATKYREALLNKAQQTQLWAYMGQTIDNLGCKTILVNGAQDHAHLFLGLNPTCSIADLTRDVKRSSSVWINEQKWFAGKFAWQEGYGAFSYGRSQVNDVFHYIQNQEEHHKKRSFREEYLDMLRKFEVEFNDTFLFDFID